VDYFKAMKATSCEVSDLEMAMAASLDSEGTLKMEASQKIIV
jgi:hypothetical protein